MIKKDSKTFIIGASILIIGILIGAILNGVFFETTQDSNLNNNIEIQDEEFNELLVGILQQDDELQDLQNRALEIDDNLDRRAKRVVDMSQVRNLANTLEESVVMVWNCWRYEGYELKYPTYGVLGKLHQVEGKAYSCMQVNNEIGISGTGYFISTNCCLLTNRHVAPGDGFIELSDRVSVERVFIVELSNGDLHRAYSVKTQTLSQYPQNDMSLLRINDFSSTPIKFAKSHPLDGAQIITVGHPSWLGFWVKSVGTHIGKYNGDYIMSLPAMSGASGSPVINMNGELIGMVKSIFLAYPIGPNYNRVISPDNFGEEQYDRMITFSDNIFDIKAFVSGTRCQT